MDKIAVLIPCYNESATVAKVVDDWMRALPDATVYVYDNNSTDGTAELAREAGAVVRHEYQGGAWHFALKTLLYGDVACLLQFVNLYAQVACRCTCLLAQKDKICTLNAQ